MKKLFSSLSIVMLIMLFALSANAQLTGPKSIPGDYATVDAAITDLNAQGVGAGGVTFNVAAGHTETAPIGGYQITTLTGTNANPIIFQKSGVGTNPTFTASGSLVAGTLTDGIFKIIGADYVTINGFTMQENPANTTTTAGSNNMTEWGVALLYATTTDGAQNNTITNCVITLGATYQNAFGIYSNVRHSATAPTTTADITAASGSNSNNTFTLNSISNVNMGIIAVGSLTGAFMDTGLSANQNGVSNYGVSISISSFVSVSGSVNGILLNNQQNFTLNLNSLISSNGGVTGTGTIRGIYVQTTGTLPTTGSFTRTITNNQVTVRGGNAANILQGIATEGGNSTISLNISNNNFLNFGYTVAATGATTFILSAVAQNTDINGNTFTNMTINSSGSVTFISNSFTRPANGICNVNNNSIVTGFNKSVAGGTVTLYTSNSTSPTSVTETNSGNNFSNITLTGATTLAGWGSTDGSTSVPFGPNKTITNNTFTNIIGGTSALTILSVAYSNSGSTTNNVSGNIINNITNGGAITCITSATATQNFFDNTINTVSTTAGAVSGLVIGGATVQNVFRNKIYDLQSNNATGTVNGILLSAATTGMTINVYNNVIGDLRAPITSSTTDAIRGISTTGAGTTGTFNISNNSIYINAVSSGTNFNTSGIFHTFNTTATTSSLVMRGNVIVNTSTAMGSGKTSAFRRSAATNLNNYNTSSDYNLFYAGVPSATNVIYYDGTNFDQTIGDFKTRVTPREVNSVTENPTFMSTAGSNANFLRPDSTVATFIESGATSVAGITTDYRNLPRYPNAGYPNNPSFPAFAPDMGAYEFGGIWNDVNGPSITYTALISTASTSNRQLTATITDPSGVATGVNGPRLYYKKSTDVSYIFDNNPGVSGNDYTFTINNAALGGVAPGDIIQYYVAAQDLIPNLRTNPAGGSGVNPPGTTAPGSPNSYNITSSPLNGTYTVGLTLFNTVTGRNLSIEERTRTVSQEVPIVEDQMVQKNSNEPTSTTVNDQRTRTSTISVEEKYSVLIENGREYNGSLYHELTDAERNQFGLSSDNMAIYATITAALTDLNSRGVDGHTTLSLVDATYPTETYPLVFNVNNVAMPSASATVTLKPAVGVSPTISGALASAGLIKVNNSYVIIDGSNVVSGTSRDMTITNTSTTSPSVIHFASTGTTPITNGTLKNCTIINGINTATAIVVSDNTLGSAGYFNNITVQNNSIQRAYMGAYNITVPNIGNGTGLSYIGNDFTTSGAMAIRYTGIYIQGVDGATVSQNMFANFETTSNEDDRGIWLATSTRNTVVEKNFIDSLRYTGTGGYGCYGIAVSSALTGSGNIIRNNSISGLSGDGWTFVSVLGDNTHGIYLFGTAQTGIDVFYNSINLYGNTLNQTDALSTGICLATGTTAELKNNIIVNNLGLFAATGNGSTGIYLQTGASQLESSDYNNILVTPTGSGIKVVGKAASTNYTTLADWRTFSSTDANSISWDPQFVSNDFLLPQSGAMNGTAMPLASVNDDILGNSRSTSVANGPTDIGAFEKTGGTTTSMVHTINADGTYNFGFGGTIVGSIIITGYTADAPFDITWIRYSGMTPPNAPGGSQYAIGYDSIWVSNGSFSATSYELRVNVNKNSVFNIADSTKMVLAKTNSNGAVWQDAPGTTNGYVGGYPMGYAYATGLTSFSLFAITSTDAPLPVELASFTSVVNRNSVKLNWTTSEEQNNAGFDIERKPVGSETWNKIGNVAGSGNSSQPKNYSFTDNGINTGSYNYRLKQVDFNGNFQYFDLSGEVIVGVPADFKLSQNYPNPFNPTTKIDYDLPVDSKVNLRVYDMLGREVASIVNEQVTAGYYTVQLNATNFASGTYFFRLVAQGTNGKEFVMTKKMQLIK